jgi:hypothetical protein
MKGRQLRGFLLYLLFHLTKEGPLPPDNCKYNVRKPKNPEKKMECFHKHASSKKNKFESIRDCSTLSKP